MSESKTSKSKAIRTRVKLTDVADAAGVHASTVSRVLRPGYKGKISKEVVDRVKSVARDLGYQPNTLAASMRTKSTGTVGFVVHDLRDPIYPPILNGIEHVLSQHGISVLIGNTGYKIETEIEIVDRMLSRQIDGIFLGTTLLEDPVVDKLNALDTALVSILRQTKKNDIPSVTSDCYGGMQSLTEHVLTLGYRDIAVIHAPFNLSTAVQRWQGIQHTLEQWGIDLPSHRVASVTRMSEVEGEQQAVALLEASPDLPEVIMCVNDLVAVGAIMACKRFGLSIPEDIAVTGHNDIPLMNIIAPPLTTVGMKLYEIGLAAGEMMLDQVKQSSQLPTNIEVETELICRDSLLSRW